MGIEIFHLSHHGLSYIPSHAQSSDKIFGEYIMIGHTENNMPTYRDNFDNGKFSIWSCGHVWMVGYTKVIMKFVKIIKINLLVFPTHYAPEIFKMWS